MWVARDGSRYESVGRQHVVELIKNAAGVWAPTGLDHIVAGSRFNLRLAVPVNVVALRAA
jgi:hypothetical protein